MEAYFKFINSHLDSGWKMTATNCDEEGCRGTLLAHLDKKKTICPKCKAEKDAEFEVKQSAPIDYGAMDDDEDLDDLASDLVKTQTSQRTPDPDYDKRTKRMSECLLLGYTMLEDCCGDCNLPFMRDRKGKSFCVGCDKLLKPRNSEIVEQDQSSNQAPKKVEEKPSHLTSVQKELGGLTGNQSATMQKPAGQLQVQPQQPPMVPRQGANYGVTATDIEQETMKVFKSCVHRAIQEIYELPGINYREKAVMMSQLLTSVKMI